MKILVATLEPLSSNTSATIQNKQIINSLILGGHQVDVLTLEDNEEGSSYDIQMAIDNLNIHTYYKIPLQKKYLALAEKKENYNKRKTAKQIIMYYLKKIYKLFNVYEGIKVNIPNIQMLDINFNQYDLLVTISDPKSSHLIGEYLYNKKFYNNTWYQYWGDPMYIDITRKKGFIKNILVKKSEKKMISLANKVFYASPITLKVQKEVYPKLSQRMEYCNQVASKITHKKSKSDFQLGYFGAYVSYVRNIMPLYNCLCRVNVKSIIAGNSDLTFPSTKNVTIFQRLPYMDALNYENNSDILVTLCNSSGTQIPGKIYYCASYNKPIIVIVDGEYSKELISYLQTFDRYIICDNNEESILQAITIAQTMVNNKITLSKFLQEDYIEQKMLENSH